MTLLDAPERLASWAGDVVRENFKTVVAIGVVLFLLVSFDVVSLPAVGIPLWLKVTGTFAAVAAAGGMFLATVYFDAPDPDWNYVLEENVDDEHCPRISRVTDQVLQDMDVVGGRLRAPPGSDVYRCRWWNRDPEHPVAHCTWNDLPDDAELLGTKPSAIEDEIASLRATYEDTHGKHQWVLDHLYMIVRKLDYHRTKSQNSVLEENVAPSMTDNSVADVVDEVVPAEIQPDQFDAGDNVRDDGPGDLVTDLEDEAEAIGTEPAPPQPAATDGGEPADE